MFSIDGQSTLLGLCVALGIGLLIGIDRERRKGVGPTRGSAGIRTFALASLLGAVAMLLGSNLMLAVATIVVGGLAILGYQRSKKDDPGMTSEIALILTCLLGGLSMREPLLAAAIGAALAVLLAAKSRIHHFVSSVLTERELHDALLFITAALILLPLAPDRFLGPFDAINPREIAMLIVLVMGISALGYIAMRSLGLRFGLPLAGLTAGFISSTATIYSMGIRATNHPTQMLAATAGAVLSSIATIIQMAVIVAVIEPALLNRLYVPLLLGGIAAGLYGLLFIRRAISADAGQPADLGRAFDPKSAVVFAALITVVLVISAGVNAWMGSQGIMLSAAITGLADAHSTAASAASLAEAGKISVEEALWPTLIGFTTNSLMKIIVAFKTGSRHFAARVMPGVVLMTAAVWLGVWI